MKKFSVLFIAFLISLSSFAFAEQDGIDENAEFITAKGKIIEMVSDTDEGNSDTYSTDLSYRIQTVKIKILDGKFKDKVFKVDHNISGNFAYDIILEEGNKVVVSIMENGTDNPEVLVSDFARDRYLLALVLIFIALLLIVGGRQGIKSVLTLLITGVVIMYAMLPLILKGFSPIIVTIVAAIFIAFITFLIVGGLNSKSIAALIGTASGVIIAGVLAYIVGSMVKLTGLSSEEAGMLMHIPQGIQFDFRSLLFSGIIIGTLGAVMDVAMSISSSMYELKEISPDMDHKSLIKSGFNIGRDIMGTMSNTLILAYTGSSIPLLLLFMSYNTSISKIFNLDLIATEVVRALVGSIGLVVAIPITAVCAGLIFKTKQEKKVQ